MSIHARLASHVFVTFEAFKNWMVIQQIDMATKPDRAPILRAGQRVTIRETRSVYVVVQHITDVADILSPDLKGGFLPQLLSGQSSLFPVYSPAKTRIETFSAATPGTLTLAINEGLAVQNAKVTLAFEGQEENWNRTSTIQVLEEGRVTLNTGNYSVQFRSGTGLARYKPGNDIDLERNSSYLAILQNASSVQLIGTGKSTFTLSKSIPETPSLASHEVIPSERAVSESLFNLNTKLSKAIEDSNGFLRYAGVDPITHTVVTVSENEAAVDIAHAEDSISELPTPMTEALYALVLNDNSSVKVLRSETRVLPIYSANPMYIGEGTYGTSNVSILLTNAYPDAKSGNIVANFDTNSEWAYNGLNWSETLRPAGDSKYMHNLNYLGIYAPKKTDSVLGKAIGMVFPAAPDGSIVNSTLTNTEWTIDDGAWLNTGNPTGTTGFVNNPKVSGSFTWDNTNDNQVRLALAARYKKTLDHGKIISVAGRTEWIYDAYNSTNPWTNSGLPAGSSTDVPNEQYLGVGAYGIEEKAANTILLAYPGALNGDTVGNTDSDTDWMFDGTTWSDTEQKQGYYSIKPNPLYGGEYSFDQNNAEEVSGAIKGTYPNAPKGNITYALDFNSEWQKGEDGEWFNTFNPLYTTPTTVTNPKILGTFNYLESWTPPAEALKAVFPNARYGSFVGNTSTGTEWELSREDLAWQDTKRPIGTTPTLDNELYLGTAAYGTNPPTDTYILPLAYPLAEEGNFVHNLTTDTYWTVLRGHWVNTKAKLLNRWMYDQVGVYEWEDKGQSGVQPGYMFHLTTRYPSTDKSEIYWFANSWNVLDFDSRSIGGFTNDQAGTITGHKSFGYIESEVLESGVAVGKVSGMVSDGKGGLFLNDAGKYTPIVTIQTIEDNTDIYVDFDKGNDSNTGFSSEQAWATIAKAKVFLASASSSFDYDLGLGKLPSKITLHLAGENTLQDLTIESASYLNIVGPGTAAPAVCKKLHIINSTVSLKGVKAADALVAWKSIVRIEEPSSVNGIDLVESKVEQLALLTLPTAVSTYPTINIDERSSFYHGNRIETGVVLAASTTFLNILGTYIKVSNGSFKSLTNTTLRGIKVSFGMQARVIGADTTWLNSSIPYSGFSTEATGDPVTVPALRSLYGTEEKTGFQIANGRDLVDVLGSNVSSDVPYAVCASGASVAAKNVSLDGLNLSAGTVINVLFSTVNTATNPTLNVNSSGAKPITCWGQAPEVGQLAAGQAYTMLYTGSAWQIIGGMSPYPIGQYVWFEDELVRPGFKPCNANVVSNFSATYPQMAAYLSTTHGAKRLFASLAEYEAAHNAVWATLADGSQIRWNNIGGAAKFWWNKAADTLLMPDLTGMLREMAGYDSLGVGDVQGDGERRKSGKVSLLFPGGYEASTTSGVFRTSGSRSAAYGTASSWGSLEFDNAGSVPIAAKNQPRAWGALACAYLGTPAS